jgi:hypothetical protein
LCLPEDGGNIRLDIPGGAGATPEVAMYVCQQCQEEYSALDPACPKCGGVGRDPDFLRGIPEPGDPAELIEDWQVVLRSPDEVQARLAQGFLETQGIETMIYPLEGATGLETFGQLPIADMSNPNTGHDVAPARHRMMPIKLVVAPEKAQEALTLLRDLREHPVVLREGEDVGEEA